MDSGRGPGGWYRLGESQQLDLLRRSKMCSTSRGVCSHCNLERVHADSDFIAGGYRVAVQLIVVGVHAAEGPIWFI